MMMMSRVRLRRIVYKAMFTGIPDAMWRAVLVKFRRKTEGNRSLGATRRSLGQSVGLAARRSSFLLAIVATNAARHFDICIATKAGYIALLQSVR